MENFQEIIKVSEGALAWTYLFSENRIGKVSRHWHQGLELTLVLDGEDADRLREQFEKLYDIFINRVSSPYAQLAINAMVCGIAYTLFTCFCQDAFDPVISSEKYKKGCKSLVDYIDGHYREEITLESLSEEFHISRDHLSRIFRNCMGTSFKKHLTRTRMYHAYKLLIHTDLTLLEISMKCGFSDSRAFISSFKEIYHTTPSKYRMSLEKISDIEERAENRKAEFFKDRGESGGALREDGGQVHLGTL